MQTVRQLASGLVYASVALLLVIGGLSLSLAQGGGIAPAPSVATARPAVTAETLQPATSAARESTPAPLTGSPAPTNSSPAPTTTQPPPTLAKTTRPTSTPAHTCGPPYGWLRGYTVQPGDTLYRIATMHNVTVQALQRANCKSGTLIYTGELLWVPFLLPPPTELTIIPTFPTPTEPGATQASDTAMTAAAETQDP